MEQSVAGSNPVSHPKIFMKIIISFFYLIIGYLVSFLTKKILYYFLIGIKKTNNEKLFKKTTTLKNFFDGIIYVLIYFIVLVLILNLWGVNIIPFLTGAGIVGLSLSLGFQTLIKDLISGVILILSDDFNVGDEIRIGNHQGKVYKITLRQTILKDENDNKIYIQNSQINSFLKIKK